MEVLLQRLIDAETSAEKVIKDADRQRAAIIAGAREDARRTEAHFAQRVAEIQAEFMDQALQRAENHDRDTQLRLARELDAMRESAVAGRTQAVAAALDIILAGGD